MSVVLSTTVGNAMLDLIDDAVNGGTGAGDIQFATSSAFTTILATMTLSDPAFAAASSKTLTLDVTPVPSGTVAAGGGTVTYARFRDSSATEVFRCTVGTSNADIIFDVVVWAESATVYLNSCEITIA